MQYQVLLTVNEFSPKSPNQTAHRSLTFREWNNINKEINSKPVEKITKQKNNGRLKKPAKMAPTNPTNSANQLNAPMDKENILTAAQQQRLLYLQRNPPSQLQESTFPQGTTKQTVVKSQSHASFLSYNANSAKDSEEMHSRSSVLHVQYKPNDTTITQNSKQYESNEAPLSPTLTRNNSRLSSRKPLQDKQPDLQTSRRPRLEKSHTFCVEEPETASTMTNPNSFKTLSVFKYDNEEAEILFDDKDNSSSGTTTHLLRSATMARASPMKNNQEWDPDTLASPRRKVKLTSASFYERDSSLKVEQSPSSPPEKRKSLQIEVDFSSPSKTLPKDQISFQQTYLLSAQKRIPKAGTLKAILQWLISENSDPKVLNGFMLCYRSLGITPLQVFLELQAIYKSVDEIPDKSLQPANFARSLKTWSKKRIIQFMSSWLKQCTEEELFTAATIPADFIKAANDATKVVKPLTLAKRIKRFLKLLKKDDFTYDCRALRMMTKATPSQPEGLLSPNSSARIRKLSQISIETLESKELGQFTSLRKHTPAKIAETMLLIEFRLFKRIQIHTEFNNGHWNKPSMRKQKAPNVCKLIDRFNVATFWVATEIIKLPPHKHASMIAKFILVAEECKKMGNFNCLMEIIAGLNLSPVQALSNAWKKVNEKTLEMFKEHEKLMDSANNYKRYRMELEKLNQSRLAKPSSSCERPIMPFFGVYCSGITASEENNQNQVVSPQRARKIAENQSVVDNEGSVKPEAERQGVSGPSETKDESGMLINFEKARILGGILNEMQSFQKQNCDALEEDVVLHNYLLNLVTLESDTLYSMAKAANQK